MQLAAYHWKIAVFFVAIACSSNAFANSLPLQPLQPLESAACEVRALNKTEALELVKERMRVEISAVPGVRRLYLKVVQRGLRQRILTRCLAAESCTSEEVRHTVEEMIRETNMPNSVTAGLLVAAMTTNASLLAGLNWLVPASWSTFTSNLAVQISVITAVMMAPLAEPITNLIRRSFFAMTNNSGGRATGPSGQLHSLAPNIHAFYTLFAQQMADRITNLRLIFMQNLSQIRAAIEKEEWDEVAEWLGGFAIDARHMYSEIPTDHPSLMRAARAAQLHTLTHREQIFARTIAVIAREVPTEMAPGAQPEHNGQLPPGDYYRRLIGSILGVAPTNTVNAVGQIQAAQNRNAELAASFSEVSGQIAAALSAEDWQKVQHGITIFAIQARLLFSSVPLDDANLVRLARAPLLRALNLTRREELFRESLNAIYNSGPIVLASGDDPSALPAREYYASLLSRILDVPLPK